MNDDDDEFCPPPAWNEAPTELSPPPDRIAELAEGCIAYLKKKYGVSLDFQSETLSVLDHYVRESRAEVQARPEVLDLLQASIGAYLGEVFRQNFGGVWQLGDDVAKWRLLFFRAHLSTNPIGMAREALLSDETDGWHAHLAFDEAMREPVMARIEALPESDADEYYLPSTRFDVLQLVHEALRGQMEAEGTLDVTFDIEDYKLN